MLRPPASLTSLAAENLSSVAKELLPQPTTHALFEDFGVKTVTWDENGLMCKPDGEWTLRFVRNLAGVNKRVHGILEHVIWNKIRIKDQEMLEHVIAKGRIHGYIKILSLIPDSFYLESSRQLALLHSIRRGQLEGLALSVFPNLVLDNLPEGPTPIHDLYEELLPHVATLDIHNLHITTCLMGVSRSMRLITGLRTLEIEDAGFWDGGDATSYQNRILDQVNTVRILIENSRETLEKIKWRTKIHRIRPQDYATIDITACLIRADLNLPCLRTLEIYDTTVEIGLFTTFVASHPDISSISFFPQVPVILPPLPSNLTALSTNCFVPTGTPLFLPDTLTTLAIRKDGPLLPPPPDPYVPVLPVALRTLHAHISPRVRPESLENLLRSLPNLEDVEILVKPLDWRASCVCPRVQNGLVSYDHAYSKHLKPSQRVGMDGFDGDDVDMSMEAPGGSQEEATAASSETSEELEARSLGWTRELTISKLSSILTSLPHLSMLSINHDHHLSRRPFPDIHHCSRGSLPVLIPEWWAREKDEFMEMVCEVMDGRGLRDLGMIPDGRSGAGSDNGSGEGRAMIRVPSLISSTSPPGWAWLGPDGDLAQRAGGSTSIGLRDGKGKEKEVAEGSAGSRASRSQSQPDGIHNRSLDGPDGEIADGLHPSTKPVLIPNGDADPANTPDGISDLDPPSDGSFNEGRHSSKQRARISDGSFSDPAGSTSDVGGPSTSARNENLVGLGLSHRLGRPGLSSSLSDSRDGSGSGGVSGAGTTSTARMGQMDKLRSVRWRVCESECESWIIFDQMMNGEVEARLEVEAW